MRQTGVPTSMVAFRGKKIPQSCGLTETADFSPKFFVCALRIQSIFTDRLAGGPHKVD